MRYDNAKDLLPEELVALLQNYVQGSYLYVPRKEGEEKKMRKKTVYAVEMEKRDKHIYEKHLKGWDNFRIGELYHISGSSVRRIISKERRKFAEEKMKISDLLNHWNIHSKEEEICQIQDSVWEAAGEYVLKAYENCRELERNIQFMKVLRSMNIPAAEPVSSEHGDDYICFEGRYYLLTRKLPGSRIDDVKERVALGRRMGEIIGKLHLAFQQCDNDEEFWDNSLLREMKGWVKEDLSRDEWSVIAETEFVTAVSELESVYDQLPCQLIHRDVHFGNFLFQNGVFTGYIDFDLSQRNIRIFDLCYFAMGLLAEEEGNRLDRKEWFRLLSDIVSGYENQISLTDAEKKAFPWVMENIELLFTAWFIKINDTRCAEDAAHLFRFVRDHETEVRRAAGTFRGGRPADA